MTRILKRSFDRHLFRSIQKFPHKDMALSYAKGLRKRGLLGVPVLVRTTHESYGYQVWARGKDTRDYGARR